MFACDQGLMPKHVRCRIKEVESKKKQTMSDRHATDVMSVKGKCSDRNKKTGDNLEMVGFSF